MYKQISKAMPNTSGPNRFECSTCEHFLKEYFRYKIGWVHTWVWCWLCVESPLDPVGAWGMSQKKGGHNAEIEVTEVLQTWCMIFLVVKLWLWHHCTAGFQPLPFLLEKRAAICLHALLVLAMENRVTCHRTLSLGSKQGVLKCKNLSFLLDVPSFLEQQLILWRWWILMILVFLVPILEMSWRKRTSSQRSFLSVRTVCWL